MGRASRVPALILLFALACSGCTWSMFGFGPDNTRFNPVVTALDTSTVGVMVPKGSGATGGMIDSSPAVVATGANGQVTGVVYVGSEDGKLYAFDEFGSSGCSGTPKACTPLWTARTGSEITSSPAVVNGVVYVGSWDGKLYAFDAAGHSGCSGSPQTCTPLWTGPTSQQVIGPPTVANGAVYVTSNDGKLYAFDATGTKSCSGTPKTCAPLWTAAFSVSANVAVAPAVANGIVYAAANGALLAFDAAGTKNCSGTPKTCAPLWTTGTAIAEETNTVDSSPTVANGIVYINSYNVTIPPLPAPQVPTPSNARLWAFDAAGTTNCSDTPKACAPLWAALTGDGAESRPAVADGSVYTASFDASFSTGTVWAFDATAATNCTGSPKICAPLWTAVTNGPIVFSSPAIENGILFVGSDDHNVYAFDGAGTKDCSGTPKTCTPLWTGATGGMVRSSPTPAGTAMYVGSEDQKLYAFGLP